MWGCKFMRRILAACADFLFSRPSFVGLTGSGLSLSHSGAADLNVTMKDLTPILGADVAGGVGHSRVFVVTEVDGHFGFERGLKDSFGDLLE